MTQIKAFICGLQGPELTREEYNFFKSHNPFGFILFARNCQNPDQIKKLIVDLKECVGRSYLPILIDQEGGRVVRLKPPYFNAYPPVGLFANMARNDLTLAKRLLYLNYRLLALDLYSLGINVNCAPVADILFPDSDDIIGDRSFGDNVRQVSSLANITCKALFASGVIPIIKHIPGHGRATADSHKTLPVVQTPRSELSKTDFAVFRKLNHMPIAMTAHVVYKAIDSIAATMSSRVINIIRNDIGFKGILLTDDLSMKALDNMSYAERTSQSIKAGCDLVLHCNGNMQEMQEIITNVPVIGKKLQKYLAQFSHLKPKKLLQPQKILAELSRQTGWQYRK